MEFMLSLNKKKARIVQRTTINYKRKGDDL